MLSLCVLSLCGAGALARENSALPRDCRREGALSVH